MLTALVVLGILLGVVLAILLVASGKPDPFRNERSTVIQAPAEQLFPLVNDFHRWSEWSPFEKLDPAMQRRFNGNATGLGSVYEWSGNKQAGSGRMEIIESAAPSRIRIQLEFMTPFKAKNTAEFTFVPQGGGTKVTWAMFGDRPFAAKVMCLFIDLDKMIGKDFDTGLASMKRIGESA